MQSLDRTMSNMVAFVQLKTGAIRRHLLDKLRDMRHSVTDYTGADPTGVKDSTAAFDAARAATAGVYFIPNGVYKVTGTAVLSDRFTAGESVRLMIGSTEYDVSAAVSGSFRLFKPESITYLRDASNGANLVGFGTDLVQFPIAPVFNVGWKVGGGTTGNMSLTLTATASAHHLETPGARHMTFGSNGAVGFFGSAGVLRPTVTGAAGGNAALTSLLAGLHQLGIINNASTA